MTEQDWIFHITSRDAWDSARRQASYTADSLAAQGFIHASTRAQVLRTAGLFYRGQTGLVLLAIEPAQVTADIRYEDLTGEGQLFPHIYGPLNVDAIAAWADFPPDMEGAFHFPQHFQAVI
jgi:uncharacterized protein (DUF952 family)